MRMCTCTGACQAQDVQSASHMCMHMRTNTEVKIDSRAVKYDAARKMPPASQQPARSGEAGAGRCV